MFQVFRSSRHQTGLFLNLFYAGWTLMFVCLIFGHPLDLVEFGEATGA